MSNTPELTSNVDTEHTALNTSEERGKVRIDLGHAGVIEIDGDTKLYIDQMLEANNQLLFEKVTSQLNAIITDPVVLGSLTANILQRALTDVTHGIKNSPQNRAAQLVVVAGYIRGAARILVSDTGEMRVWYIREDFDKTSTVIPEESDWVPAPADDAVYVMRQVRDGLYATILASGIQPNTYCYMTTDATLNERASELRELFAQLRSQGGEAIPVASE